MTSPFTELVEQIEFGSARSHGPLTLIPISWKPGMPPAPAFDYLTLDQALAQKSARVMEVTEQGSVPQMAVVNEGKLPVFLPDGTMLLGCKQNRVVNISILLAPQSVTVIPVSCVEQGRWRQHSTEMKPGHFGDPKLRSRMSDQASRSLRAHGQVQVDQGEVWSHVEDLLESTKSYSATRAYQAAFQQSEETIGQSLQELAYPEGAAGVALVIEGRLASLDLFDRAATLAQLWERILPGALLASHQARQSAVPLPDVKQVLVEELQRPSLEVSGIGSGTHYRFDGERTVGSGLIYQNRPVHVALFGASKA